MNKQLANLLVVSAILSQSVLYAQVSNAQSVETKSFREQKIEQLKNDLKSEKDQLSALEKMKATGLGISQSWGKHVVVLGGSLGLGLWAKGYFKSNINTWIVVGVSTALASMGEQVIVMMDESKLENEIITAKYNINRISEQIEKRKIENNNKNVTSEEVRKVNDLIQELNRVKSDLASLETISRAGMKVTTQAGRHLVAAGLSASAAMILKGGMKEPNAKAIGGAALSTFALTELFVVFRDASTLREMITEKRMVVETLEKQIEDIQNQSK